MMPTFPSRRRWTSWDRSTSSPAANGSVQAKGKPKPYLIEIAAPVAGRIDALSGVPILASRSPYPHHPTVANIDHRGTRWRSKRLTTSASPPLCINSRRKRRLSYRLAPAFSAGGHRPFERPPRGHALELL